jgi:lysine 2,3-aminomutase
MNRWISSLAELQEYLLRRYSHAAAEPTATEQLVQTLLSKDESDGLRGFPLRIPYYYADLIDWHNPVDPLRLIAVPRNEEENIQSYELTDPIGDHDREAVPGLIHRYPDRCLLLLTSHCKIHCRFCFRREVVGKARPVNFAEIKKYLVAHPEVKEVIFSGGDPGTFPPAFLDNIRRQLSGIPHIERWRFHTRVPAVDPESLTEEWLDIAAQFVGKVIIVIHIDHPYEVTTAVKDLVNKMLARKILVLSQSVLLKNINASVETLKIFFTQLVSAGVKPYYLHHLDRARGTSHFRVSILEGKNIFKSLRGTLSSVCMPEYVLDLPGGFGKVPVLWLESIGNSQYKAVTFEGKEVIYTDY